MVEIAERYESDIDLLVIIKDLSVDLQESGEGHEQKTGRLGIENAGSLMCEEFRKQELVLTETMAGYNGLRDSMRDRETGLLCVANPEAMA